MHSLVYGTPVISHDNPTRQGPEYESIINDFSGYLFKENDVKSLSNTIKKCKHSLNNNIINRQSCRSVITSKYSFEYQGKVFNELINRLEAEV